MNNRINLGNTDIKISPIGLGIMQWGKIEIDSSDTQTNQGVLDIFTTVMNAGINLLDSAEMYGNGRSETHLGRILKLSNYDVVIATKFMPFPWRLSKGELRSALLRSLKRLDVSHVDLYQMHWPIPPVPIKSWMDAMSDAVADGLIRAVGVSNYSPSQTRLAYESLAKHHIPLASNQVRYSLLNRKPERSGLVDLCKELNVTIIAYSPLEKGVLTGKYTPGLPPTGIRSWSYNKNYLQKIQPLIDAIREIGEAHTKSPAQVALNWLICKGVVPIPGARNKQKAQDNAGGIGWQLTGEEVANLDRMSDKVNR